MTRLDWRLTHRRAAHAPSFSSSSLVADNASDACAFSRAAAAAAAAMRSRPSKYVAGAPRISSASCSGGTRTADAAMRAQAASRSEAERSNLPRID